MDAPTFSLLAIFFLRKNKVKSKCPPPPRVSKMYQKKKKKRLDVHPVLAPFFCSIIHTFKTYITVLTTNFDYVRLFKMQYDLILHIRAERQSDSALCGGFSLATR